ncbi:MAG: DNA polymerase III subunit beta [Candidatus Komeilibacteria bacterium]
MKFICTRENLNNGLSVVNHLASHNANLPILNNVLVDAKDGIITLATTNLEIGIKVVVRGKIETEGSYTVPARLFSDFVSLLPNENVDIDLETDGLNVRCKNSQTQIKGMLSEDYPLIPDVSSDKKVSIDMQVFKETLGQTVFAATLDDNRPEISGVFFNFKGQDLVVAATDSYRLAEKRIKVENSIDQKVIIPLKTLQELSRILANTTEKKIEIYLNENQIAFSCNNIVLTSRLIDGNYPDYEQIIPTDEKTVTKVGVSELVKAIKGASLFCKTGINDIKMTIIPSKNEVVILSTNSGLGENITNIKADIKGEEVEIVFNYRYLLDGLNNLQSEQVIIKTSNQGAPGVFVPDNKEGYLYIVMPIRQ